MKQGSKTKKKYKG